jgi:hypothetical protein
MAIIQSMLSSSLFSSLILILISSTQDLALPLSQLTQPLISLISITSKEVEEVDPKYTLNSFSTSMVDHI